MSAWSQGYVNTKPKPTNPFVSMGTLAMMNQAAQTAPGSSAQASVAGPAQVAAPGIPIDFHNDPVWQARVAQIMARRDRNLSDLDTQEVQTKRAYGIDDTSDPFSKAKLMQESFQRNKAATTTGLAARGQLYSGAMQNAQNENQRSFNENNDALVKAFEAAKAAIAQRRNDVRDTAEADTTGETGNAMDRLLATRPDADLAGSQFSGDLGDAAGTSETGPVMQQALKPKTGYAYVAKTGARKGQSYNVVKSGSKVYHKYANGKTIRVS